LKTVGEVVDMVNVPKMFCLAAYLPLKTVGEVVDMVNVPKMFCLMGRARKNGLVEFTVTEAQQPGKSTLVKDSLKVNKMNR
jgi:hypothetical protein